MKICFPKGSAGSIPAVRTIIIAGWLGAVDNGNRHGGQSVSEGRSCMKELPMPAKSAAQQKAAGAALSAKRGDTPKSELKGASKSMAESMSNAELEKMASTSRKGKPEHKGD